MNFALFGDHPDGLDMAQALAGSGRHRLLYYCGPVAGADFLQRSEIACPHVGDPEAVLAQPAVEAIVVAGNPGDRPALVRRALQSERHVLCVHPIASSPDAAYEADILRKDSGRVLLPLLAEVLHPSFDQFAQLIARDRVRPGAPRLLQMERWATEAIVREAEDAEHKPGFPGWDVLRRVGGEIIEVSAFAQETEAGPADPVLLSGCFERGGMFQVVLVPNQPEARWRLNVLMHDDTAELLFPDGWPGPARLRWRDEQGGWCEQTWETWNPWPRLVKVFEQAAARPPGRPFPLDTAIMLQGRTAGSVTTAMPPPEAAVNGPAAPAPEALPARETTPITWTDEVRCLELDDAARRSLERRRSSTLEYQEAIEEATFKGTMTLAGCALLWASLFLLICSIWIPYLGWVIVPLFTTFLGLQLLRWLIPRRTAILPTAVNEAIRTTEAKQSDQ
jgi:predicted dehydrogenase